MNVFMPDLVVSLVFITYAIVVLLKWVESSLSGPVLHHI